MATMMIPERIYVADVKATLLGSIYVAGVIERIFLLMDDK